MHYVPTSFRRPRIGVGVVSGTGIHTDTAASIVARRLANPPRLAGMRDAAQSDAELAN
jgi:hypothetical protein